MNEWDLIDVQHVVHDATDGRLQALYGEHMHLFVSVDQRLNFVECWKHVIIIMEGASKQVIPEKW